MNHDDNMVISGFFLSSTRMELSRNKAFYLKIKIKGIKISTNP